MVANNKSDLEMYLEHGIDYRRKSMDIVGDIEEAHVEIWCRTIRALDRTHPGKPLRIYLNSEGGDVYQGLAVYDTIRSCESEVHILVVGNCMSIAVWILQAADRRGMSENSRMMLHVGSFGLDVDHQHTNLRWAKQYEKDEKILNQILVSATGLSLPATKKILAHDTIYTRDEAITAGLIDGETGYEL